MLKGILEIKVNNTKDYKNTDLTTIKAVKVEKGCYSFQFRKNSLKGGITISDKGTYTAVVNTNSKDYKTLKGALNFMTKYGYTQVIEIVEVNKTNIEIISNDIYDEKVITTKSIDTVNGKEVEVYLIYTIAGKTIELNNNKVTIESLEKEFGTIEEIITAEGNVITVTANPEFSNDWRANISTTKATTEETTNIITNTEKKYLENLTTEYANKVREEATEESKIKITVYGEGKREKKTFTDIKAATQEFNARLQDSYNINKEYKGTYNKTFIVLALPEVENEIKFRYDLNEKYNYTDNILEFILAEEKKELKFMCENKHKYTWIKNIDINIENYKEFFNIIEKYIEEYNKNNIIDCKDFKNIETLRDNYITNWISIPEEIQEFILSCDNYDIRLQEVLLYKNNQILASIGAYIHRKEIEVTSIGAGELFQWAFYNGYTLNNLIQNSNKVESKINSIDGYNNIIDISSILNNDKTIIDDIIEL